MISRFTVIVAAAACLITFFVVRRILRDQLKLGPPGLLAAAVAALAFLGLCGSGEGLVGVLLIPYATLALTLLLLFLLLWLFRLAGLRPKGRRSQEDVFRQHAKRVCNRSSASAPRSGLSIASRLSHVEMELQNPARSIRPSSDLEHFPG